MNPEKFLTKVAQTLEREKPAESGLYSLVLEGDDTVLLSGHILSPRDKVLAVLTSVDINEGPRPTMWAQIKNRYALFAVGAKK